MIEAIQELNFPGYATMSSATVSLPDMGEWTITSQIKIDGQVRPDFSYDWEVVHEGHKYIQPLRKPQGSKENTSLNSVIDLTFQHWAIWQLKRWYFFTVQPMEAGVAWPDKYIASVSLNLGDFCKMLGQVLEYYYGDKITVALNPGWQYKSEPEVVEISYTHIWDVLIKLYEIYGVRWVIEPDGSPEKYVIKVGYGTTEQSHIFEYGFEGGLMKVERQVQSEDICNMLLGRGGEKNLPYRYFKNIDPENDTFPADPDWIEELANIYFANLMPATFRSYVQGWKAAHLNATDEDGNLLYEGYTPVGEANAYAPWAYRKGLTDEKFDPVEYVADEITIDPVIDEDDPEKSDRVVVISPTYAPWVKWDSSIAKYGPLLNGLENNDEIYPTIQGVTVEPYGRIDEVVEVEPIVSDDVEAATENDAQVSTIEPCDPVTERVAANSTKVIELTGGWFTVREGQTANFNEGRKVVMAKKIIKNKTYDFYWDFDKGRWVIGTKVTEVEADATIEGIVVGETTVVLDSSEGGTVAASGIPAGRYRYRVSCSVENSTGVDHKVTLSLEGPTLTAATLDDRWRSTWRIWVKNIWQTSKGENEAGAQYAKRVWEPILGDRVGNEAKVVFGSGALAHEDYEFVITVIPKYDRKLCKWVTVENGERVEHEYWSEWCIELGKSDAEMEALGVYMPSVERQAVAGDFFFFIGIDMPHLYTVWGEERVDGWKNDYLSEKKDIKPTWVVQTDRVRMNELMGGGNWTNKTNLLALRPGDSLRLADRRFIDGVYETLYLSSITYTYREPTSDDAALNPDIEIVLSDRYEVSASPVATLQGEVSALAKQVGSISNIEQIVRAVGDKLYLRKDGLPDRSLSPTEFGSLLSSIGFRSGMVGGAGWGVYKDANGNWVIEADRLMVREDLEVNNLVVNQVLGQGGMTVESGAVMEITRVDETGSGYKCYFDQHEGTVANLFHVGDVAWNNRFTPENDELKFYRRRVTEVGADYVVLTKPLYGIDRPTGWPDSGVNGTGVPAVGDVIVQRGSYTDANRRYMKVRDVIGGGYERWIEGLDSVNAEGVEYYFVGRQTGMYNGRPRWFIGDENGFIEWINGVLNVKARLNVLSTVGDKTIGEYVDGKAKDAADEAIGNLEVGTRNLLRNTGTTYWTNARADNNDWVVYLPKVSTAIPMVEGATYTIRGRSTGVFASDHAEALNAAPNNRVTVWLVNDTTYQLVSDGETGSTGGTTFVWNKPSGDYFVRLNSYGQVHEFSELMLVRGNCIASEWSMAPEDRDEQMEALDYLKESIRDAEQESGSMIGGLILASLLRLGYKDSNGEYKTMAGINGQVDNTLAVWAGGEQIDAAMDALRGALFGIRHDGTAYAAGNTVRFGVNKMEVGDSIVLNDTGMVLRDDDGNVRCVVSNQTAPDFDKGLGGIEETVEKTEVVTANLVSGSVYGNCVTFPQGLSIPIGFVDDGKTITVKASFSVGFQYASNAKKPRNTRATLYIYEKNGMGGKALRASNELAHKYNGTYESFEGAVSYMSSENVEYVAELEVEGDDAFNQPNSSENRVETVDTGIVVHLLTNIKVGHPEQTTIYNNGFSSAWGDSTLLAASADGAFLLAGGYGLKVTPTGIYRRDNGGAWVKM